ncbi:Oxygen tolerance [Lutibacter agarilyticus]|uniref:Oxygen tolerance n=1 Tax=Lutibacter agarilyticus TaxID=1109740 RepID=A0A238VWU8_9FLAO|nr:BatD family protein [Lutibacter agarilyticus]SNR38805.1 Oxygen tolerance [Lutibacter agarilyticus]
MKFKKFFILSILVFVTQVMFAQIEFTTSVSKSKLGVNQRFKIQFTVNKQGADNFKPPSFANFKVVGGPSSSVNQSWINGKTSYSQSYVYIVEPTKVGEFTIGSAKIEYKDKTISSNPVKITVTKEVEIPKDPNNPQYVAQQNIHLVAEVSNMKPYVGEGIYVVYKLYVSENISVNDWRVSESPQYNGFWNQDIEVKEINVQKGTYNGESYRYIVLKKAVLIPQREGKLIIEPMKMDFSVGIPTGRGDFFGNMITKNISYSAQSLVRNVNVQALPIEGKPIDFTGAVGEFDFKVATNKNQLKANDAAQIVVEVSGRGNLKLFEIPKITTPAELEVYTPEHKEKVVTSLSGLRGSISDTYTVVPQYKGKYKIPAVSFSYFNPKEKQYKTVNIDPIIVDVLEGKEIPTTNADSSFITKQQVVANDNNFRFIALKSTFETKQKKEFLHSKQFWLLLLLPFLAIPIGIFIGRRRAKRAGDVFGNKIRKADRLARKYLSQAKKQLGNQEAFYIALEKALHNFLKAKLHVETSDISKEKITEILQNKGVELSTIEEFMAVLNDCDFARYTPTTNVKMTQELEKAKEVITKIDKYL